MTGEELLDSMEYIDAVWVETAENPAPKQRLRKGWIGVIAACLAVVIGVYLFLPNRVLVFTPWQIVDLMLGEGEIAGDTQHYMTIDLGKNQELLLAPLPDSEYVPVFYKNKTKLPEGENMMKEWLWPIMYRLKDSLGVETLDGYDLLTDQGRYNQYYSFVIEKSRKDQYGNCDIWLDGELISVDTSQSDEEILASLESAKEKLFNICGQEFSDAVVIRWQRDYNSNTTYIIYYDKSAHPLNEYLLVSDYYRLVSDAIVITVDDCDYQGIWSSADDRVSVKIRYRKQVASPDSRYITRGKVKLLSLEEAEEMLEKGYVFAPGCETCISMQPGVDFSDYDYVSFEYLQDAEAGSNWVLPFYAFYKKIKDNPNGTVTYAKTYVCAMEVPGLEAYFNSQKH